MDRFAFYRPEVRIEHEAALVESFDQDHPAIGILFQAQGGQTGGRRIVDGGRALRFPKPIVELLDGVLEHAWDYITGVLRLFRLRFPGPSPSALLGGCRSQ